MSSRAQGTATRDDRCPHRCGYRYPIPACVRLHLIQHHDYEYDAAQKLWPDDRCAACGGTGYEAVVSHEMASDACSPEMEGQPIPCSLGCVLPQRTEPVNVPF